MAPQWTLPALVRWLAGLERVPGRAELAETGGLRAGPTREVTPHRREAEVTGPALPPGVHGRLVTGGQGYAVLCFDVTEVEPRPAQRVALGWLEQPPSGFEPQHATLREGRRLLWTDFRWRTPAGSLWLRFDAEQRHLMEIGLRS